ncbi:unnamed protein product, partial [Brassica oleracea]
DLPNIPLLDHRRNQENSCRPFRRTLTGSLQLTRERVEV